MARVRRQRETSPTPVARPRSLRWQHAIWLAAILAALSVLLLGRGAFGRWCRYRAASDIEVWALGDARKWLDRAARIQPRSPATELLRAQCFRQLRDMKQRDEALDRARKYGASPRALQYETLLGNIQQGDVGEEAASRLGELMEAGISAHDIAATYISGSIAQKNTQRATELLDAWSQDSPQQPHTVYLRGVLCTLERDTAGAKEAFEKTLAMEPRHELARLALAQWYEAQNQAEAAVEQFLPLAEAHADNGLIATGFARSLRKLGRLAQAKSILEPFASRPDALSMEVVEMGYIDTEIGDYRAAKEWFDRAAPSSMTSDEAITTASITLAMLGEIAAADGAFTWMFQYKAAKALSNDLQAHLAVDPQDQAAESLLRKTTEELASAPPTENPYQNALWEAAARERTATPGPRLYDRHCSACHGTAGDGRGRAARHVFPQPRNLRTEPMRLVSAQNGVPTRDDIRAVIQLGIPGTSMVPLDTLSDSELDLLVDVVLDMRREGVRQQYIAQLEQDEEPVDDDDVTEVVQLRTTPTELVTVPDMDNEAADSVALGKKLYIQQACHSCHGETGTGDQTMPLFDVAGRPDFPRDLVHDFFKGGNTSASIYRRIVLGMPGTLHPANVSMAVQELIDLTLYCRSLGQEPKRVMTNHQRAIQAARRPAIEWSVAP